MLNLIDIDSNRERSQEEYLISINNSIKRQMVSDMFRAGNQLIESIRNTLNPKPDNPLIRITSSNKLDAGGIDGMIKLSSGFIEYCLAVQMPSIQDLINVEPSDYFLPDLQSNYLFCFTLAHEFFHGVRKNSIVTDVKGNDLITQQALEMDADLCAIGSIYNWFKEGDIGSLYSTNTLKQIIFVGIFWAIRNLPENQSAESTHPTITDRIFNIIGKLAMLRSDPRSSPDPSMLLDESRKSLEIILDCLIRCEQNFQNFFSEEYGNLFSKMLQKLEYEKGQVGNEAIKRWDQIRVLVSVASGTKS